MNNENEFDQYFDKYINAFKEYLPKKDVEIIIKVCMQINENNKSNSEPLNNVDSMDLQKMKVNTLTCLKKISEKISSFIFYGARKNNQDLHIDNEITVCDFILKIKQLSNHKIDFLNKLEKINYNWIENIIDHNDGFYGFDEETLDLYFSRKNDFFNGLDKYGQDIFNLQYFYLGIISLIELKNNNNFNLVNLIIDKLCQQLDKIKFNENEKSTLDTSLQLSKSLRAFYLPPNDIKDNFFKVLKFLDLNNPFSVDIGLFESAISQYNFDFFNELFELFPEMNNFRLKFSSLAMDLNKFDMFDYFLNKEYISTLNKIKEDDVKLITGSDIKKNIPWVNHQIHNNIYEMDTILLRIFKSTEKELFLQRFSLKDYKGFDVLSINTLVDELELKNKNFNLNLYLSFVKPLLTTKILEDSIVKVKRLKGDVNINIIDSFEKSLQLSIENLNHVKKIKSIKLKK